jgi:hypothetical protein
MSAQASMQCYAGAPTSSASSPTAEPSPVSSGPSLPSRTTSGPLLAVTSGSSHSRSRATTRRPNPTRGQRSRTVPSHTDEGVRPSKSPGLPRSEPIAVRDQLGLMRALSHLTTAYTTRRDLSRCRAPACSDRRRAGPRGSSCLPPLKSMSERCLGSTRQPGCRHRSARHAFSRGAGSAGL